MSNRLNVLFVCNANYFFNSPITSYTALIFNYKLSELCSFDTPLNKMPES